MNEHDIRRVFREELARLLNIDLGRFPRPLPSRAVDVDPVREFAATLLPGERIAAGELFERWKVWAAREGLGAASMTSTAFGRAAMRCGAFSRQGTGRRVYTVLGTPPGCVGAPGCTEPMLKMSDRCARHQVGGGGRAQEGDAERLA